MRLKVDRESDALYFRLTDAPIVESEQVRPDLVLDFDAEGNMVGMELLNLSKRVTAEQLRLLEFETA